MTLRNMAMLMLAGKEIGNFRFDRASSNACTARAA